MPRTKTKRTPKKRYTAYFDAEGHWNCPACGTTNKIKEQGEKVCSKCSALSYVIREPMGREEYWQEIDAFLAEKA